MADISKIPRQSSQLEYVCRLARDCPDLPMTISNIDTLRQIAYFRVFICKVVEVAYFDVIEKKYSSEHRRKLEELYSLLQSTCIEEDSRNLREFFLRQFIRNFGLIMLKQLIAVEKFQWLWPEEDSEVCCLINYFGVNVIFIIRLEVLLFLSHFLTRLAHTP